MGIVPPPPRFSLRIDDALDSRMQMETDARLLSLAPPFLLRLYVFSPPALSFGRRQSPVHNVDDAELRRRGWPLVRRPTGGGIVLHRHDITFSLFLSTTAFTSPWDAYARVSGAVRRALGALGVPLDPPGTSPGILSDNAAPVCFLGAHARELRVGGRKIAGIAMRWASSACLCQGTILGRDNAADLAACLIPRGEDSRREVEDRLRAASLPLEKALGTLPPLSVARGALVAGFLEEFADLAGL